MGFCGACVVEMGLSDLEGGACVCRWLSMFGRVCGEVGKGDVETVSGWCEGWVELGAICKHEMA